MKNRRQSPSAPARYDPGSLDATLATIIGDIASAKKTIVDRLDGQDIELAAIKTQAIKTNGRVGVLERWRETSTAKLAGICSALGLVGGILFELGKILLK